MADNTIDDTSGNPENPPPENLPNEIVPQANIEITSPNQETENMEVHHHPNLHHKAKPWKEYFLEFLMIFLAVTMGFFAEGLRKHINDRAKEKEFMRSVIDDLKYDTSKYQKVISDIDILKPALDSSYTNIKDASRFNYTLLGKWQFAINQMSVEYRPGLPTIQQMKSSGNLRLIENKEVGKQILQYEAFVKGSIERANDNTHAARAKVYAMEDASCDYTNFRKVDIGQKVNLNDPINYVGYNMPIIEKDVLKQNEFANSFINYKAIITSYKRSASQAKDNAADLIKLISTAYHFE